jgi:hypothetical protein
MRSCAPSATSAEGSVSPGPPTARHFPSSGFLAPSTGCSPSGLRGHARSAAAHGVLARRALSSGKARDASPRLLRPLVRGALQSRTLRNTRSRAPQPPRHLSPSALVPRPWFQSPQAPSGAHHSQAVAGAFAPAGPLTCLSPRRSGRTMARQAGTPGSFTSPGTGGSTRDPQLPWGFRCIRKTFWRLPMLSPPGTGIPGGAGSSRSLPRETLAMVSRRTRPFHVIGLSKSRILGQPSRRLGTSSKVG